MALSHWVPGPGSVLLYVKEGTLGSPRLSSCECVYTVCSWLVSQKGAFGLSDSIKPRLYFNSRATQEWSGDSSQTEE